MKKSFPLFLLLSGLFLYGQTSVYAATVNSTINLTINCDQKCQNDALILYRFQGQITETLHKNVTLVNEANANVTCSDFDLGIDKSVQVRSNPTQGEWFVTGGPYDSPPSDGVLYELAGSAYLAGSVWNRFYVGASVPSDLNTVALTSQDPSIVRCNANGCTALKEGTTNITLSFPVQNQVANLPVTERDKWGTFNARGDFIQYELEGSATGYGKILFMAEQKNGTRITRSKPIIMTYSFPSITCRVTVPPRPNRDHEVECKNVNPISDSDARVNWIYSDADNDVQINYQIEVATRNDFAQNSIVKRETAPANTNIAAVRNKLISDLAPNTQYYVRIRAYNPVNNWSDYSVCSGGFKTLEEGGCPSGQTKNTQGICVTPPGGPCNNNNVCDLNEGCACSDCAGNADNCQVGLVCKYIAGNPIQSSCQPNCTTSQVWNGSACVTPANGLCGTADGRTYPQDANGYGSDIQCTRGDASLTFFPAPGDTARWVCRGRNGGDDSAECTASRQGAGICGTATKTYDWNETTFGTDTLCRTGSPVGSVAFPVAGQTVSWTCPARDGLPNTTCFANRGLQPICGTNDSRGLPGDAFPSGTIEFPLGSGYCRNGSASDTPSFPALGARVSWTCTTGNGPDANCEALRAIGNNLCLEGETYVSSSTKASKCCTATEVTTNFEGCANIVCNTDGICNANEGCACGDCRDQQDHCAVGAVCSGTASSAACCPAGKVWNTTTKTCDTTTPLCLEGETYVATSIKSNKCCTAQEVASNEYSCRNTVCNTDGICNANEGCTCGDCRDQQDHCAVGTVCSGTAPSAACCPAGKAWNTTTKTCDTTTPLCPTTETYVSTSTKASKCCTATEVTTNFEGCANIVCNTDGICNANEGCTCGDCRDQQDHCAVGTVCSGTAPSAACCPSGETWNSGTKACEIVTPLCLEGETYVSSSTKTSKCCTATEVANNQFNCRNTVCNTDGICNANEGCTCGDCRDQQDHCAVGTVCSGIGTNAACCPSGETWNTTTKTCDTDNTQSCSTTQAPEIININSIPFIGCTETSKGTHFKYTLTDPQGRIYTSPVYALNLSPIRHISALTMEGNYQVRCFYGNPTTQTTRGCVDSDVDQIIRVVPSNGQACTAIRVYNKATAIETYTSQNAFEGSVVCQSYQGFTAGTPFSFKFGTNTWQDNIAFTTTAVDVLLGSSYLSATKQYTFGSGGTAVECRVKSGNGYVTSSDCQKQVCIGGNCPGPETFNVVSSKNIVCTTLPDSEYYMGCASADPSANAVCVSKFKDIVEGRTLPQISGNQDGVSSPFYPVTCQQGSNLPPGVPVIGNNITCLITLPSGEAVPLFSGDFGSRDPLQTITEVAAKDTTDPIGTLVDSAGAATSFTRTLWSNQPLTVGVKCVNDPQNTDACTCAGVGSTDPLLRGNWASNTLADTNIFTRTFSEDGRYAGDLRVLDNAGNDSSPLSVSFGIDKARPVIERTAAGNSFTVVNGDIRITATDNPSGIIETDKFSGIIDNDHTGSIPADSPQKASCEPALGQFANTLPMQSSLSFAPPVSGYKVAYCFRDAAGNEVHGTYPEVPVPIHGCFADGTMNTVPTLTTYADVLEARISGAIPKFGYALSDSERATQNATFQTRLTQNINTYIIGQYNSTPVTPLAAQSLMLSDSTGSDTNGYYYFTSTTGGTVNISTTGNNTLTTPKVVYVIGANVQINSDIKTSGNGSVVIIVKKFGQHGGNIYVDPDVGTISATLIADGALKNGENAIALQWLSETDLDKLTMNKLTINGRLFTYNTRGGSLMVNTGNLEAIPSDNNGKCSLGINQLIGACTTRPESATQDLERFRLSKTPPIANEQCTLYVTGTVPNGLPILSGVNL